MWLDCSNPLIAEPASRKVPLAPFVAGYRRGILKAKVNVQTLSRFAVSIECLERPRAGSLVWITLPGLESRSATVEGTDGIVAHLRFTEPFHPAVIDAVVDGRMTSVH